MKVKFSFKNKNNVSFLQTLTLEESYCHIKKYYPQINSNITLSYIDQENDKISILTQEDFNIFLNSQTIKHKLLIQQVNEPIYEKVKSDEEYQKIIQQELIQEKQINQISSQNKQKVEVEQIKKDKNKRKGLFKKHKLQKKCKIQKMVSQQVYKILPQIINSVLIQINSNQDIKKKKNQTIHKYVQCDGCKVNPILGIRYKCSVCNNFDFCQQCQNNKQHNHPFLKIKKPQMAPKFIITGFNETDFSTGLILKGFTQIGKQFKKIFDKVNPFNKQQRCPKRFRCDNQFNNEWKYKKIQRKCKILSQILGGLPNQYKQFVQKNFHLKIHQLIPILFNFKIQQFSQQFKIYLQRNLNKQINQKMIKMFNQIMKFKKTVVEYFPIIKNHILDQKFNYKKIDYQKFKNIMIKMITLVDNQIGGFSQQQKQFIQKHLNRLVMQMSSYLQQILVNYQCLKQKQINIQNNQSTFNTQKAEKNEQMNAQKQQINTTDNKFSPEVLEIAKKIQIFLGIESDLIKDTVKINIKQSYEKIIDLVCQSLYHS